MAWNNNDYQRNSNQRNSLDKNRRQRIEVFVKEASDKRGETYLVGYHPLVGKVNIFLFSGVGEKGYYGKVGLTANNLNK